MNNLRILLALALSFLPLAEASAGTGTITTKDAGGVTRTFAITTNGGGNFIANQVICDQSAATTCASVGTAGSPSTNAVTIQAVTLGAGTAANAMRVELPTDGTGKVTAAQATAANLNATVVGTGTFVTQSAITAASGSFSSGALASGSVASGAFASGALASGSVASGAIAAGAQVDLLTMRGTKNAGTAAANSLLAGGVYNSTPLTLTDTQQASLQADANGYLRVQQPATNTASVASWTTATAQNTVVTITNAGQYPANQLSLSASALVTAGAITFQGTKADGTDETIPVAQVLNPNTLAPLTNPYTLTTSKQDFLILSQGYQTIKAKLTTAITASGGVATTVISNTNLPYNPTISALLNPLSAGTSIIGKVGIDQTTDGTTNGVRQTNAYPAGATAITASATGTTGATTATLAGTSAKTTYICGYSIRANATANINVTNTITGVITATLSSIMWVPANTAGLGIDEQIFSPCIPASATNTGIAVVSGAPGSGGLVSSRAWGYQQ